MKRIFHFKTCHWICLYLRVERVVVSELDAKEGQEGDFDLEILKVTFYAV
jgi:hypothetical protein